jgi:uncharacterized protein YndB with AHSA1/START domain
MKYSIEMLIDLPRTRVIELFDNPENLPKWQTGLKSFDLIHAEAGQPGAKSRLIYDMGNRQVEMIETIEKRSLPDEFSGIYEARGVWNHISNRFSEEGAEKTRWVVETEFKFQGLMKLMAIFMRGSFPKQTRQSMQDFKVFAEANA